MTLMLRNMTALDTNIIIRLITQDDLVQFKQARTLVASSVCFIPDTVLLEAVWVLRSIYHANRTQIHQELTTLLGLPNIRVAHPERLLKVLEWYADGLDFADAMHLADVQHLAQFATFDQQFIKRAAGKGTCEVTKPD